MPNVPIPSLAKNLYAYSVTIPAGAAASEIMDTQGLALVGIIMPGAWTSADIAYKGCLSGNLNDLLPVYTSGGSVARTAAAASTAIAFPAPDAMFMPYLQILSVSTSDPTSGATQAAARTITLYFRSLFS